MSTLDLWNLTGPAPSQTRPVHTRDGSRRAMRIRSKAPLRVSFAGGGTDVPPFPQMEGGAVLSATINRYAYASLTSRTDGQVGLHSSDFGLSMQFDGSTLPTVDGRLDLVTAAIRRLHVDERRGYDLHLHAGAPPGSGLGSSSSVMVALIALLDDYYGLSLSPYELARLAWSVEREDLGITGGQQDQYAATFGGFNYIEFFGDHVVVNPLRIPDDALSELEHNLLLCFTGQTRASSQVIDDQTARLVGGESSTVGGMRAQLRLVGEMKRLLLQQRMDDFGALLGEAWEEKKRLSPKVTNSFIDNVYEKARAGGALGGKVTGAGGGGYLLLYCEFEKRPNVVEVLRGLNVTAEEIKFEGRGCTTWHQ